MNKGAELAGRELSVELIPSADLASQLMREGNSVVGMRRFWGR
jgi:hypothetical protein